MTIDEVISVLEMQEEILQFSHFTNADAWTLGNMRVRHRWPDLNAAGGGSAEKRRFGDDQYPAEQRVYRVPVRL